MIEESRSNETELISYIGVLHLYSATGTEGSFLAFYDREIDPKKPKDDNWYRFHYIKDGDGLVIYGKEDPGKIVWQGQISLKDSDGTKLDKYGDMWKCVSQQGSTIDEFIYWFNNDYPAKLTTAAKKEGKPKPKRIKYYWEEGARNKYMIDHFNSMREAAVDAVDEPVPVKAREFSSRWVKRVNELWGEKYIGLIDPDDYNWEFRKFSDEETKKTEI